MWPNHLKALHRSGQSLLMEAKKYPSRSLMKEVETWRHRRDRYAAMRLNYHLGQRKYLRYEPLEIEQSRIGSITSYGTKTITKIHRVSLVPRYLWLYIHYTTQIHKKYQKTSEICNFCCTRNSNVAQRKAKKMMKRRRNLSGKAQLNACKIGSHFSQHCANSLNLTLILVKVWLRRHFVQRMRGSPLKALVRGRRTILDSGFDFERVRVLFCKFVVNSRERGKE